MTSHSTEHHSVEESLEKRVQLPSPDANNITVLTSELPNEPILPWHRFDSPWLRHDAESTPETLEEFVERSDVELHAVDTHVLESTDETSDTRKADFPSSAEEGAEATEVEKSEARVNSEEQNAGEWLTEDCLDEGSELEVQGSDEELEDIVDPDEVDQSETLQEQRRVYLPEPDPSLVDPNVPLGTLSGSPPISYDFPDEEAQSGDPSLESHDQDADEPSLEISETPISSRSSQSAIRMDGAVSLTGDRHETDSDASLNLDPDTEFLDG